MEVITILVSFPPRLLFSSFFIPPATTFSFISDPQELTKIVDNDLSVSLIDDNGFGAYEKCNFYSDEGPVFTRGVEHDDGNGTIAIGPPQPVYMVACQPTPGGSNTCLPVYSKLQHISFKSFHTPATSASLAFRFILAEKS